MTSTLTDIIDTTFPLPKPIVEEASVPETTNEFDESLDPSDVSDTV